MSRLRLFYTKINSKGYSPVNLHWGRVCSLPNFSSVSSEGIFHVCERGNTQRRFSNAFYGHLWAFSLGARRDDTVFSVARLPVEISVGRDDMGDVCYQLKKASISLSRRGVSRQRSPHEDISGFHTTHRAHTRRTVEKIGMGEVGLSSISGCCRFRFRAR